MTTAFVLSGGASLGSVQVGMALALEERGVVPDLIVGTSVGAINGGWLAGGGEVRDLADLWRSLHRRDLFPTRPLLGLRAFLGRSDHFVPDTALRRTLRRHLPYTRIEDAAIPLIVVAADAIGGHEVLIDRGSAVDAIVASSSLPAVFRPAEFEGRHLIDGAVVNNTPITVAIEAGATEVWVLSTSYSNHLAELPANALAAALHAVGLMVQRRLVLEVAARRYTVPVYFIPPPANMAISPIDFSHSSELIAEAASGTRRWLDAGRPHTNLLSE